MRRAGPMLTVACVLSAALALCALALLQGASPAPRGRPGQEVALAGPSGRWAIASSPAVLDELLDDPGRESSLRAGGRLAGVEAGRRVRLLEYAVPSRAWRVEVLDGPRAGAVGWMRESALGE